MRTAKEILPGILIALLITIVSIMLSTLHPSFDSLVISILFGMLAANFIRDFSLFEKGIGTVLKIALPIGISLYGAQLKFSGSGQNLWWGIGIFILFFSVAYLIGKGINLSKNTNLLIATGLSICGASAIAIVSPMVQAKKEETSISVIVVLVVGLIGMLFYPLLTDLLLVSKDEFGFLCGATLPMLGQVKATALSGGTDALVFATNLKLVRISCLILIPVIIILISGKKRLTPVPWFIVLFILIAIAVNMFTELRPVIPAAELISKFFLTATLAAIGLSVDFNAITDEGTRPLISAFLAWGVVVLLLYLAVNVGFIS